LSENQGVVSGQERFILKTYRHFNPSMIIFQEAILLVDRNPPVIM